MVHSKGDTALSVLTGSTNWTQSGLCTQNNNAIVIRDGKVAGWYIKYWEELKKDTEAAGPIPARPTKGISALQGEGLRELAGQPAPAVTVGSGKSKAKVKVWFSPNTSKLIPPPAKAKVVPTPADMQEIYDAIDNAKQAVLLLAFMPGQANNERSQTVVKYLSRVCAKKPWLFVRGVIGDTAEAMEFEAGRTPEMNAEIVGPAGIMAREIGRAHV